MTNDVEVLFQLLSGLGVLLGEFVPFVVALGLMLAISPALTGTVLLALPFVALATFLFRRATRTVYRAIRNSVSTLNQNLQENLAGHAGGADAPTVSVTTSTRYTDDQPTTI